MAQFKKATSRNDREFNGLSVDFGKSVVLKNMPAREFKADKLNILRVVDDSNAKTVTAFVSGPVGRVVLWEGKTYDDIGQWTDQNVIDRLKEIFN